MKITIETLTEFLDELIRETKNIHEGIIRLRKMSVEVNEVTNDISYTITALAVDSDGNGHLLRYHEECGVDVSGNGNATAKMNEGIDLLMESCDTLGIQVRPGEIEL